MACRKRQDECSVKLGCEFSVNEGNRDEQKDGKGENTVTLYILRLYRHDLNRRPWREGGDGRDHVAPQIPGE